MGQKEFVKMIQLCRSRLNMAEFLQKLVAALKIGAAAGILIQLLSFAVPLYYAGLYAGLSLLLVAATAVFMALIRRRTMEQAALVMDSFGFDERIVTAYGSLDKEGPLVELQRADAMRQLGEHPDRIRIALLPPWKKTASAAGLITVLLLLALMPSDMKERAKELHSVKEEARDKTEGIEEIVEALEQLGQDEAMTPEQQAALQEMIQTLQISQEEYQQASTAEMMKAASQKLEYRYEQMGSQLAGLAQSLRDGAAVSSVTAESMQALSRKMQEMGGAELAHGNTGQPGKDNGDSIGDNNSGGNDGKNGQNGQPGSAGSSGQNGNNGQNGNSGQNGNNGQNGSNGADGDGGQSGNNGAGGHNGGAGDGRGTGSADTPHDYVSIPNAVADSGNLTGNAVDHDASQYFHAQNGLSWEGTHMPHEAVIGSYEQNAYEGIAAGKYPSGMEEIIKEYFSNFN